MDGLNDGGTVVSFSKIVGLTMSSNSGSVSLMMLTLTGLLLSLVSISFPSSLLSSFGINSSELFVLLLLAVLFWAASIILEMFALYAITVPSDFIQMKF